MDGIVFDKDFTNAYRDKYNEPCDCEQCKLFLSEFPKKYSFLIAFLSEFGVDPFFPLEIMDLGIKDKLLQREYMVYYAVKGYLPVPKMTTTIGDVSVTMRNDDIANESYANTDMQVPFFVIELSNIFLNDNEAKGVRSH